MKEVPPLPLIKKELLESLEAVFPNKDFNTDVTLRQLDYHYGQRSVINFLKLKYNEQNENILNREK